MCVQAMVEAMWIIVPICDGAKLAVPILYIEAIYGFVLLV